MKKIDIEELKEIPFQEHVPLATFIIRGPKIDEQEPYYIGVASTMESYSGKEGKIGDFLGKFYPSSQQVCIESCNDLIEYDKKLIIEAVQQILCEELHTT